MLHNQQALVASELPVTSELSSQSETVGNQTSTELANQRQVKAKHQRQKHLKAKHLHQKSR